ncbi:MAG: NAD-dependent epimerase/dehydratase family protein [Patescibacteria group bacterium]
MKYVVTGGAGFIGSHIVDALVKEGHEVCVIDNLITGKLIHLEDSKRKITFYHRDISNFNDVTMSMTQEAFKGADGIFHTAALARIQPSFDNPNLYFKVNAEGTRNILMAAKNHGVRRVVYSASSSAYGNLTGFEFPVLENHQVDSQALHPYGSTKRMGEMLMRDMGKMTGGPETVCPRYFNVYGPRQTNATDGPYPTVIGIFCDLLKQGKPLTIVPDGHQRRDFTHVSDVVRANLLAMHSPKVGNAEIINIGTGCNYSMWDVAKMMLEKHPNTATQDLIDAGLCKLIAERRGEARVSLADISKAKELLGWKPEMSLDEGLKQLLGK